jgi:hypothetical protein
MSLMILGAWEMSNNRTESAINAKTAQRQQLSGRFSNMENRHGTDSV